MHLLNPHGNDPPPSPLPTAFTLATPPGTDIWRKPPATHSFNAPILYSDFALDAFNHVRVTVGGAWKTLFDQGGLVLELLPTEQDGERKWVKAGIEFFDGKPHIGVVACDRWADWTLLELDGDEATIEMEREVDLGGRTSSLWIYVIGAEGKRRPIREITWVFGSHEPGNSYKTCRVGVYAAKPKGDEDDKARSLTVTFKNLEIDS
jgi:regulation of enolase protein 1 (concanavalin A-like superfamily)